jgi:hypothetical protein
VLNPLEMDMDDEDEMLVGVPSSSHLQLLTRHSSRNHCSRRPKRRSPSQNSPYPHHRHLTRLIETN